MLLPLLTLLVLHYSQRAHNLWMPLSQDKVKGQLVAAGIFNAIEIRQKGYPLNLPKADFVRQYKDVLPFVEDDHKRYLNPSSRDISKFLEKLLTRAKERSEGKVGEKAAIEGKDKIVYRFILQAELDNILAAKERWAKCHQIAWRSKKHVKKKQKQAMDERSKSEAQRRELLSWIAAGNAEALGKASELFYLAGPKECINNVKAFQDLLLQAPRLSEMMSHIIAREPSHIAHEEESRLRETAQQAEQVQER